jgi:hypothetical protein
MANLAPSRPPAIAASKIRRQAIRVRGRASRLQRIEAKARGAG